MWFEDWKFFQSFGKNSQPLNLDQFYIDIVVYLLQYFIFEFGENGSFSVGCRNMNHSGALTSERIVLGISGCILHLAVLVGDSVFPPSSQRDLTHAAIAACMCCFDQICRK